MTGFSHAFHGEMPVDFHGLQSACIWAVMVISHFVHRGQERRQGSLVWGVLQRNCGAHKISNASKDNTSYTTCTAAVCH